MSEQNKDNISQFFRKAVQKPKIRFVESDWEKLEARLDEDSVAGAPKHNHWRTAFIAAVALLFVTTALLLYNGHQANTNTIVEKTEVTNAKEGLTSSTSPSSKNDEPSDEKQELKIQKSETGNENTIHSSHSTNARRKEINV